MLIKLRFLWLMGVILCGPALAGQAQSPALRHVPPEKYLRSEPLVLRAESEARLEWLIVFWKIAQAEDYESLNLETKEGRVYEGRLETASLAVDSLSYYLAYKTGGQIHFLPEDAPASVFILTAAEPSKVLAQAPLSPPPLAPVSRPFPLRLDGSAETNVYHTGDDSPTSIGQSHNLRLEYGYRSERLSLDLGGRLAYTYRPVAGENPFDIPDLALSATSGSHTLRLGDLSLAESEFSVMAYGRRGLEYRLQNSGLEVHVFTAATQQVRGFKGLGWPKKGASLIGGSVGLTLFKALTLKAVFVRGEDDPALGVNAGAASIYQRRKGQVLAFIGESRFWGDSLGLQAEFALSRYDADTTDDEGLAPGRAVRLLGSFRKGFFDLQAGYHTIGKDFNTVGQPFLLNDRRGYDAVAGLSFGRLRLSGSFRAEETNVEDDPDLAAARLRQGRADLSFGFGTSSTARLGYLNERQDAHFSTGVWNPYPAFEGTLDKTGLSGGLDIGLASWLRLSFSGEKADLRCGQTPSLAGGQTAFLAGLQVLIPDRLSLFPVVSYSRVNQTQAGTETKSLMASLNGELTLVRRWLTWNITLALGDSESGPEATTKSYSADTGINVNLRPLMPLGEAQISLRGQYFRTTTTGQTAESIRAVVRLTYSL